MGAVEVRAEQRVNLGVDFSFRLKTGCLCEADMRGPHGHAPLYLLRSMITVAGYTEGAWQWQWGKPQTKLMITRKNY